MVKVLTAGECSTELSPEEEKLVIRDIAMAAEAQTNEGDAFYLMTQRWWQNWMDFVNNNQTNGTNEGSSSDHQNSGCPSTLKRPPSIDNSDLIFKAASEKSTTDIELHDTLVEGTDYILLPEEAWSQLYAWYGGGPALARKVISTGLSQTDLSVEVYPLRLYLHLMPKGDQYTIRISKKETIGTLHRKACEYFGLNSDKVCIWDYYSQRKYALLNDLDKTLDDANIHMDQDILVEVIDYSDGCMSAVQENGFAGKDSSTHVEPSNTHYSSAAGFSASKGVSTNCNSELSQVQNLSSATRELDKPPVSVGVTRRGSSGGLIGLLNFGNTCFMNSAIQCLIHIPEFARYFHEDYHQEINRHNPLGMEGELAVAFGELLRRLWAPGRAPFAPRHFKTKLSRFAPQFGGNNQHDSQELLAFLLDGLHEDLNRVKHKPYIESRDADGRPDEQVADEYWANHIARNDSIIVDVCQGQYKSTLVCPVCDMISVTFDPFMYLSLPLQSTTSRSMTVMVFSCDGSALPATYTVAVPKQGRCKDLILALGRACSLKPNEKILLAEIRDHLIHQFLEDPLMSLSSIKDDDHLSAYKIPKVMENTRFLQLVHRREELETGNAQATTWKTYGTPLVFPISSDATITGDDIQFVAHTMLSPMLKTKNLSHPNVSATNTSSVKSDPSSANNASEACRDSNIESSDSKAALLEPPLKLVDENNVEIDISVGEERTIKLPSSSVSVLLYIDWSPDLLKKYEMRHLETLPEVLKHGTKRSRMEPLSLYTCLEAFLREEPLVPEEMWLCPQCKERRRASKKLDLWRLPQVLVIHLKRFSYNRHVKHKLDTNVSFPIHDLDLTTYIANKNNSDRHVYELYALINHYGGMGGGHYTAYVKHFSVNKWYNFDDSHVSPINEDDVKSNAAYVLFYRRVKADVSATASSNGAAEPSPDDN